jgi:hypothetical protein
MFAELVREHQNYSHPAFTYRLDPPYLGNEYLDIEVMPPAPSREWSIDHVGMKPRIVMRWCDEHSRCRSMYFNRIPNTQNPLDGLASLGYELGAYDPKVWKPVPLF